MGKHDDDKDRSQQKPDPSKWEKPNDDGGGKHANGKSGKDDPKK